MPGEKGPNKEGGVTLIELMIALVVLMVAIVGTAQLFALAVVMNKNNGSDATKAAALAQAKIEELKSLAFSDQTSNTAVDPPYPSNGTGLLSGGSLPPAAPVANYVDYVDPNGVKTSAFNAGFIRQWQIVNDSATLKRIMVTVTSTQSFNYGAAPSTTLVTYKTQ